jgi:hypothetical protein
MASYRFHGPFVDDRCWSLIIGQCSAARPRVAKNLSRASGALRIAHAQHKLQRSRTF